MSARSLIALVAAITAVAILGGCGSDSDESQAQGSGASGDSSLDRAEFVEQVNAACQKEREGGFAKVALYVKAHRSDGLPEEALEAKAVRTTLLSTIAAEIAAIRQQDAPAGDEEEIEAILAALEADFGKAKAKSAPKAIEHTFLDSGKKLKSYGLAGCAKYTG